MNHTREMRVHADAAIALEHIHSARDKIRGLMDLYGLQFDFDVN